MPNDTANATTAPLVEIYPPRRPDKGPTILCDCCRMQKSTSAFDADCLGICMDCLKDDFWIDAGTESCPPLLCKIGG